MRRTGNFGLHSWMNRVAVGCSAAAVLALVISGCSSGGSTANGTKPRTPRSHSSTPANDAQLAIYPAAGSKNVDPSHGITVTAARGKITNVSVQAQGSGQVPGSMNATSTGWHSTWALAISTRYTVTATATDSSGHPVTETSSFTTLTPARTFQTVIFEGENQTYGVGMPIMLTFSQPIQNKAAVESALQVQTSNPVVGAWYWDGNQTLDFRPRDYWPPNTTVSFTGHLNGVEAAPGMYGDHTLTQQFKIGESLIVVASTSNHHMLVYRNNHLYARWPISTGRPGDNTPNGSYLTIEKANPVLMKGPGYAVEVPWSVRITFSGDYLHDAYWSVGEQGFTNVSHGCVNMPPLDAEIYYKMEVPGDPVTIWGSPRGGIWDNGWTQWFLSWPELLRGSALHEAVQAGPQGSTFISPNSVPASTATSPLGTAQPGNSNAS